MTAPHDHDAAALREGEALRGADALAPARALADALAARMAAAFLRGHRVEMFDDGAPWWRAAQVFARTAITPEWALPRVMLVPCVADDGAPAVLTATLDGDGAFDWTLTTDLAAADAELAALTAQGEAARASYERAGEVAPPIAPPEVREARLAAEVERELEAQEKDAARREEEAWTDAHWGYLETRREGDGLAYFLRDRRVASGTPLDVAGEDAAWTPGVFVVTERDLHVECASARVVVTRYTALRWPRGARLPPPEPAAPGARDALGARPGREGQLARCDLGGAGLRHYLAGRLVYRGAALELRLPDGTWLAGTYDWTCSVSDPPVLRCDGARHALADDAVLRWPTR